MNIREQLAAQKSEGEREFAQKLAEERARVAEATAKARAVEEQRRSMEAEKDRKKAEEALESLPDLVRQSARNGLHAAVLTDGFVNERPDDEKPSREFLVNKRKYYLTGWQIPFFDMCKESGIPVTIVTEEVNAGIKRVLRRSYHVLAVDLEHL